MREINPARLRLKSGVENELTMKERKRIAEATARRYRKAGKKEKGEILNKFVELTGLRGATRPWGYEIKGESCR